MIFYTKYLSDKIIVICVDIIIANCSSTHHWCEKKLEKFKIKDLKIKKLLGSFIYSSYKVYAIRVNQCRYVEKLLTKFDMQK